MKLRKILFGVIVVAATATFIFTQSCTKEDEGSISDTDLSLAQDETYADALYEDVDNLVESELISLDQNGYSSSALKSGTEDVCYTVTVDHPDSTSFPKVVTLDFGDGCSVVFKGDTIIRQGQIIITITDRWFVVGAQHILSFNDFYINGIKVEGTRTNTNLGFNEQNHLERGIELENGKIIFNDTVFMTREASHVREIIRRLNPQNDTILVTGSANGINVLGENYTREITEALVLVHCDAYRWRWVISSGMVEISNSVRGNTTIDFTGSGCDGTVTIDKNGYRHNYNFKYNHREGKGGH